MVQTSDLNPLLADLNADELTHSLGTFLTPLATEITEAAHSAPGGSLEVVSHHILRIGQHLVLTLLTRREK